MSLVLCFGASRSSLLFSSENSDKWPAWLWRSVTTIAIDGFASLPAFSWKTVKLYRCSLWPCNRTMIVSLSSALDWVPWKQGSETRAVHRWIVGGCSWMIPVRKWGRQDWAEGKQTCIAVVIKASPNSMGSSGARTDLKYCPKLRNYGWTSVFLHRQVISSKPPLGKVYNSDWGSSLWLRPTPRQGWSYN